MPKDYSDFILFVFDAGERVYHLFHMRNTLERQQLNEARALVHNFHYYKYRVNMDRAYRIRWAPWKKIMRRPPYKVRVKSDWYFGTAEKNVYTKRQVLAVKIKKHFFSFDLYGTLIELTRSKKIGIIFFQEPCTHRCSTCEHKEKPICPIPTIVEPMHISRIHQPSGVMKG